MFDLDGTLVHTTPDYRYKIVKHVLNDFNIQVHNRLIDRFWFESRREEIIREHFKLEPDIFWQSFRKYRDMDFRKQCISAYNDVDFVLELKGKGFKTGIVTGAPPDVADMEIDLIGRQNFNAIVLQSLHNGKPKPHPSGIEECLAALSLTNKEAIFVGNSDEDILAAQNAKVMGVMIDRKEHEFPHVEPSLTIESLYELRQILGIE